MKKLFSFLFLSCLKATRLIEKRLAYKLSVVEKFQLHSHKLMCKACQLYDRQSSFIDSAIKNNVDLKELKNDPLKLKIVQKIEKETH